MSPVRVVQRKEKVRRWGFASADALFISCVVLRWSDEERALPARVNRHVWERTCGSARGFSGR